MFISEVMASKCGICYGKNEPVIATEMFAAKMLMYQYPPMCDKP